MAARELELKLELDSASLRQIAGWLLERKKMRGVSQCLRTVYFDTPDFTLRRSGISLRVRVAGESYLQTIKLADTGGAGYFDRDEWQTGVSRLHPDFAAARSTGLKPFRTKHLSKLVRAVFETRVQRMTYALTDRGARFELALDQGKVLAKTRTAGFCELEIEVKEGKTEDLFRIARRFARIAPLRLGVHTKADRGYALARGDESGVFRAEPSALPPRMQTADAFRLIARDCLRQLVANIPATLKGNSEALHQMRVAVRRLRAAMSVFSGMIRDSDMQKLKTEFRWITRILGAARDLDVLLDETLRERPDKSAKEGLPEIVRKFRAQRRQAYGRVGEALSSARFRNLILEILAWVECGGWQRKRSALAMAQREQAIVTYAARELGRRYRKLNKSGADFKTLNPAARHAVRIRAKKLRYAAEFFGGVFPGKRNAQRHEAILSALKELQSALGDLNDIATREGLIAGVAHSRKPKPKVGPAESVTAGVIYRSQEVRIAKLLEAANSAAQKISACQVFWE
jgi:triphosphatase